jgi:hypothetical protein
MAFYPFSGKKCNGGIPFNRIQRGHYQRLTEEWLKAIDDRSVRRVIKYIQSVSLTPDEMIELVAEGAKHCEKKPRFSKRTFQRWASMSKEPLKADRPLSQKFVRSVLRRTVLRPVKAG